MTYAINQKAFLRAFLDYGEIEISNNQVENAIRPVVNGRKNWLFADTPEGAEALAIVYTLMDLLPWADSMQKMFATIETGA